MAYEVGVCEHRLARYLCDNWRSYIKFPALRADAHVAILSIMLLLTSNSANGHCREPYLSV